MMFFIIFKIECQTLYVRRIIEPMINNVLCLQKRHDSSCHVTDVVVLGLVFVFCSLVELGLALAFCLSLLQPSHFLRSGSESFSIICDFLSVLQIYTQTSACLFTSPYRGISFSASSLLLDRLPCLVLAEKFIVPVKFLSVLCT